MPTNGFSIKPLKVKLIAGEQKATELIRCQVRFFFYSCRGLGPHGSQKDINHEWWTVMKLSTLRMKDYALYVPLQRVLTVAYGCGKLALQACVFAF